MSYMAATDRLAQVFLWKQGDAPNVSYAIELLEATNPNLSRAIAHDASLLQIFAVEGTWPSDPWVHVIKDMDVRPAPLGTRWTDPANYDLAGWHGKDLRSGENLFIVSAYRRPTQNVASTYRQEEELTPKRPVAQTPYYPQYPTGPIEWPPTSTVTVAGTADGINQDVVAPQPLSRFSPLDTGPITGGGTLEPLESAIRAALLDSYAPFYVGFGPRLVAGLIDLFCTMIFPLVAIITLIFRGENTSTSFSQYALVASLAVVVFTMYHVVQIGLWGQTLGKVIVGIKVVAPDGRVPGFGRALLRVLGYGFSVLPAGWGFIRLATDPRRQALHDRIAETFVVPERLTVPILENLPGYMVNQARAQPLSHIIGLAALANNQDFNTGLMSTVPQLPEGSDYEGGLPALLNWADSETASVTVPPHILSGIDTHSVPVAKEKKLSVEKARSLFKSGITELEKGTAPAIRGYKVDPQHARIAASLIKDALDLVPNSVAYRYFYAVALRYAEGIEPALREFRRVLELDPGHFESQQQVTYGARWHDAFSYPTWITPAPVEVGKPLPQIVAALLPEGGTPVTRMVLLREGGVKRGAFLSRTPLHAWATPPSFDMRASLHVSLSNTPFGPILALYVVMEDGVHQPYIGEAFLNPREVAQNTEDACQLGQHMLEQLARQDRTYFVFADEQNRLLFSRKVIFNTRLQIRITRCLYEVQSLPLEMREPQQFVQAAQWHMEHNSLEQVKELLLSDGER